MLAVYDERLDTTQDVLKLAKGDASAREAVEGGQTIGKVLVDVGEERYET